MAKTRRISIFEGGAPEGVLVVLHHEGKRFDAASIASAIATRAIMEDQRPGMDGMGGGPPPISKADRSNFLQALVWMG